MCSLNSRWGHANWHDKRLAKQWQEAMASGRDCVLSGTSDVMKSSWSIVTCGCFEDERVLLVQANKQSNITKIFVTIKVLFITAIARFKNFILCLFSPLHTKWYHCLVICRLFCTLTDRFRFAWLIQFNVVLNNRISIEC